MTSEHMLLTAKRYLQAELSVLPIVAGSKKPVCSWKSYETERITESELERLYRTPFHGKLPDRVAVIGGTVSGGLEMIDFDAEGIDFEPWKELIPTDLF